MRLQIKLRAIWKLVQLNQRKMLPACGCVKPPVDVQACNLSSSCAELRGVIIVTHKPFIGEGNAGAHID